MGAWPLVSLTNANGRYGSIAVDFAVECEGLGWVDCNQFPLLNSNGSDGYGPRQPDAPIQPAMACPISCGESSWT